MLDRNQYRWLRFADVGNHGRVGDWESGGVGGTAESWVQGVSRRVERGIKRFVRSIRGIDHFGLFGIIGVC